MHPLLHAVVEQVCNLRPILNRPTCDEANAARGRLKIGRRLQTCPTLLFLALLSAQQPLPQDIVKFQSTTQLVVEMVGVKDKNGKVIEGLTAKDFTVTENGVPQAIQFCEFQKLQEDQPEPAPQPASVAPLTATQIAPESPGDIRYKNRRLLALYFDMTAMPVPDQLRALSAAQKFIRAQMAPPDLIALMKFSSGSVQVLQDFTDDRDLLGTAIQKLIVGEGQGFDETPADDSAADTG